MANSKISELPSASVLVPQIIFPVVDTVAGETQKATIDQIYDLAKTQITELPFLEISSSQLDFNSLTIGTTNLVLGTTSSNISGLTSFSANQISASTYLGLPTELTKITVSSSVSLLATQRAVFANNSEMSPVTITLPSVTSADSREYYIIKADDVTGSIVVSGSGSNLINGQGAYQLNGPYQSITLITDGNNWFVF